MLRAQKVERGLGAGGPPDVSGEPHAASHFCQTKQIRHVGLLSWGVGADQTLHLHKIGGRGNTSQNTLCFLAQSFDFYPQNSSAPQAEPSVPLHRPGCGVRAETGAGISPWS